MMHCGFHGFLWVVGAIFAAKMLFRAGRRHGYYGRFGGGGCGPRHLGGGWGGGHHHGGWGGHHHGGWHGEGDQGGPWQGGPWQGGDERSSWHGGPWQGGPQHGDEQDSSPWQGRGRGGRWSFRRLGWLFQGLGTTPEQERVIHETLGELRGAGGKIAGKVAASRNQWADALEAESFDETMVGSAVADLEHAVDEARKTTIDAFAKIHATLDTEQRKKLAGALRKRRGFGGGGPFRSVL